MDLSLVLVTFRSAEVLPAALSSFRDEVANLDVAAEVVVVDHSEDRHQEHAIARLSPDRLLAQTNRGYAAGLNAGAKEARGRILILANPDIVFEKGSLAHLIEPLKGRWDVVGPQFLTGPFLHPPADLQTPWEELRRALSTRGALLWSRQVEREIQRYQKVWTATGPQAVPTLSGALLALERSTFRRLGPLDEDYFLYFEETDWLRRDGLRLAVAPAARVQHLWGHAASPKNFGLQFERSRKRYYRKQFGLWGALVAGFPRARSRPTTFRDPQTSKSKDVLWLASPTPWGLPAALWTGPSQGPGQVAEAFQTIFRHGLEVTVLTVSSDHQQVVGIWRFEPG